MNRWVKAKFILMLVFAALVGSADSAFACAACYGGKTDSPLADGMNWGIMCLLVVVVGMLGMIASFFIYLARKSATAAKETVPQGAFKPVISEA